MNNTISVLEYYEYHYYHEPVQPIIMSCPIVPKYYEQHYMHWSTMNIIIVESLHYIAEITFLSTLSTTKLRDQYVLSNSA